MSNFLFYPSPPYTHHIPVFASSFLTPQIHHASPSNFQKTTLFTPQTPSPLRTSRNANLMRAQDGMTEQSKQWQSGIQDENEFLTDATVPSEPPSSPLAHASTNVVQNSASVDASERGDVEATTFATEGFPAFQFTAQQSKASHFQQCARQSSPTAQIASHIRETRDNRKKLFLGRLRTRRSDERDERGERGLDQMERMDYLRDMQERRREFELEDARYSYQDPDLAEAELEAELSLLEMQAQRRQQPSPIEEHEIEGLIGYLQPEDESTRTDEFMFDVDDEILEEVYAEWETSSFRNNRNTNAAVAAPGSLSNGEHKAQAPVLSQDTNMDMT